MSEIAKTSKPPYMQWFLHLNELMEITNMRKWQMKCWNSLIKQEFVRLKGIIDLKGSEQVEYGAGKEKAHHSKLKVIHFQLIRDGLSL